MPDGYEYFPARDQYVDEDDRAAQQLGMERAAPLRDAMEYAAKQLRRLTGAFMAFGAPLDYREEHNAEGGQGDERC